jgi:hypothetical protein
VPKGRLVLALLIALSAASCSPVDAKAIRAEFERTHPGCHVSALQVGEGDSDNVYVQFRFRCGAESKNQEETWLYQRSGSEWKATARVPKDPKRPGSESR